VPVCLVLSICDGLLHASEALLDVTTDDLAAFAATFSDLGDDTVIDAAWR
jgi:hypothetical protein